MSKKIEVSKIIVKIGEQEIPLTVEQAKELQLALSDLVGKKEMVYIPQPYPVVRPYRYWITDTYPSTRGTYITNGSHDSVVCTIEAKN